VTREDLTSWRYIGLRADGDQLGALGPYQSALGFGSEPSGRDGLMVSVGRGARWGQVGHEQDRALNRRRGHG
jgi:hypothetical protein